MSILKVTFQHMGADGNVRTIEHYMTDSSDDLMKLPTSFVLSIQDSNQNWEVIAKESHFASLTQLRHLRMDLDAYVAKMTAIRNQPRVSLGASL